MSAINGDKARFNRKRKSGIARRARNRTQFSAVVSRTKRGARTVSESKGVSE